jgi:hypothetical protein
MQENRGTCADPPKDQNMLARTSRAVCPDDAERAWSGVAIVTVATLRAGRTTWRIWTLRVREQDVQMASKVRSETDIASVRFEIWRLKKRERGMGG